MFRRKKNFWKKRITDENLRKKYLTNLEILVWGLLKNRYYRLDDAIKEIKKDILKTKNCDWNEFAKDWNEQEIKIKTYKSIEELK